VSYHPPLSLTDNRDKTHDRRGELRKLKMSSGFNQFTNESEQKVHYNANTDMNIFGRDPNFLIRFVACWEILWALTLIPIFINFLDFLVWALGRQDETAWNIENSTASLLALLFFVVATVHGCLCSSMAILLWNNIRDLQFQESLTPRIHPICSKYVAKWVQVSFVVQQVIGAIVLTLITKKGFLIDGATIIIFNLITLPFQMFALVVARKYTNSYPRVQTIDMAIHNASLPDESIQV